MLSHIAIVSHIHALMHISQIYFLNNTNTTGNPIFISSSRPSVIPAENETGISAKPLGRSRATIKYA